MSWLREKASPFKPGHALAHGHLSDAFSYRLSDLTGTEKKAGRGLTAASKRRAELGVLCAFAAESWKLYRRLWDSELEALDTKP